MGKGGWTSYSNLPVLLVVVIHTALLVEKEIMVLVRDVEDSSVKERNACTLHAAPACLRKGDKVM